jgi:TetR/AcrR family transcriptional regulator, regulator of biofilm formation and stress response
MSTTASTRTTAPTRKTTRKDPRPRGAARREALLEAVLKIVAEVGADAVTHRRVAEVADLPLASTTYWFESKEQLLTAALELAAQRDIARLQEFIVEPLDDSADPLELAVAAILEPLDESLQASRGSLLATYALLLEAARRPSLRAVTRDWTEAYLKLLSRLFKAAGSDDPRADAELLLAAADGLLIYQLAQGTGGDLVPRLRRLASALVGR